MKFDSNERALLGKLADVLIPAGDGLQSASAAGVAGEGLDQVLAVRPELAETLKKVLAFSSALAPTDAVSQLKVNDPASFGLFAEMVAGAYFLSPQVRASLGYDGQTARPIDSRPDYLDDGLLQSAIDRGPIYRPTPGREQRSSRD